MTPELDQSTGEIMPDLTARLDMILGRSVTVESIDSYADQALADLVELVERAIELYGRGPTLAHRSDQATETAAFGYFGLGDIEPILDHLADKADQLRAIDRLIAAAPVADAVITPTEPQPIKPPDGGDSEYSEKLTMPRLKTLLFILGNEFAVDVFDPDQLGLKSGPLEDNMIRQESYFLVEVPGLNRTVLVCDELENATYVFENTTLQRFNISPSDLQALTKTDLNDLINQASEVGRRLFYNHSFVGRLIDILGNSPASIGKRVRHRLPIDNGRYLRPKLAEGNTSISRLAAAWNVSYGTVKKTAEKLMVFPTQTGSDTTIGLSPEQQAVVHAYLEANGAFEPKAPGGYASYESLSSSWAVDYKTVADAVAEISQSIGEIGEFRFYGHNAAALSPDQQAIVHAHLDAKGMFLPKAPEGYASYQSLSKLWGVEREIVIDAVAELSQSIGEVDKYKFGGRRVPGLSPDQQAIVQAHLEATDRLVPKAPVGYASYGAMAVAWEVSHKVVVDAVAGVSQAIGRVDKFKFGANFVPGLSPDQQAVVHAYLEAGGAFKPKAPPGYVSYKPLSMSWGVDRKTVIDAVAELRQTIGEIGDYIFGTNCVPGLSPDQQAVVHAYLESRGVFGAKPPDGYANYGALSKSWNVTRPDIVTAVAAVRQVIGEVGEFKFRSQVVPGLSPDQQAVVHAYLEAEGLLAPKPPAGYMSYEAWSKSLGVNRRTVARLVAELGPVIGEIDKFRFGSRRAPGLSPDQQAIIHRRLAEKGLLPNPNSAPDED